MHLVQFQVLRSLDAMLNAFNEVNGSSLCKRRAIILLSTINKRMLHTNKDYAPLNSSILRSTAMLGRNYKQYLKVMLDNEIIEQNPHFNYQAGKGSREYRIHDSSVSEMIIMDEVDQYSEPKYKRLREFFNEGLKIDRSKAERLLKSSYDIKKPKQRRTFCQQMIIVDSIIQQKPFFKVDDKGLRLHTSITMMKRELRDLLTYKGRPLVRIDISNSQPYFMWLIIEARKKSSCAISSINRPKHDSINNKIQQRVRNNTSTPPYYYVARLEDGLYMLHTFLSSPWYQRTIEYSGLEIDEAYFMFLSEMGQLYEGIDELMLHNDIDIMQGITTEMNRRKVLKKAFMFAIFSSNLGRGENSRKDIIRAGGKMKSVLRTDLPNLYNAIIDMNYQKGGKGNKGKEGLACTLQRIEAKVMLGMVCNRVFTERNDLPIWTIHDCIMTTEVNEDYISNVIKEECAKVIGVEPSVSIESIEEKSINKNAA